MEFIRELERLERLLEQEQQQAKANNNIEYENFINDLLSQTCEKAIDKKIEIN